MEKNVHCIDLGGTVVIFFTPTWLLVAVSEADERRRAECRARAVRRIQQQRYF